MLIFRMMSVFNVSAGVLFLHNPTRLAYHLGALYVMPSRMGFSSFSPPLDCLSFFFLVYCCLLTRMRAWLFPLYPKSSFSIHNLLIATHHKHQNKMSVVSLCVTRRCCRHRGPKFPRERKSNRKKATTQKNSKSDNKKI